MFPELLYQLQIKVLLAFKPAVLFDRINHLPWYKDALQQWVNGIELPEPSKILEAGCSTGLLTDYLYQQGFSVIGVDKSPAMIDQANANFPALTFQEENIFELSFDDNQFDAVVAASLINIVPDKEKAMQEMVRVCKVGGQVSLFTPLQGFTLDDLSELIHNLKVSKFSKAAIQAWYRLPPKMNEIELLALFEQAGLAKPTCTTYLQGMVAAFTATKV
ncbi:MAG: methyltransferase domain-containing protein [Mariprofundaceae bacterium]|nr:methyltransferase domain-containing protein [Mariprofundaceae bacterium]